MVTPDTELWLQSTNLLEGSSVKYDLIYVVYILDYLDIYDFKEKSNVEIP